MSNFNNQVNRKPPVVTTGVYGWVRKNLLFQAILLNDLLMT